MQEELEQFSLFEEKEGLMSNDLFPTDEGITQTQPAEEPVDVQPVANPATVFEENSKKSILRYKRKINFTFESKSRRNVDKHIIRAVFNYHDSLSSDIFKDYELYGVPISQHDNVSKSLKMLKEKEREQKSGTSKDYAKLMNMMLGSISLCIILKHCIVLSIKRLSDGQSPRMSEENRRIYITTLRDYLSFISGHLDKLPLDN